MNGITGSSARKEKAGHKWLKGFLRCYPQLKPKKAKNISVNRAMCANLITIGGFFTQYHQVCEKFNIISPMYIWNCDESGVQDVPKEEVIGVAGEKAQCQGTSDRGETSTVLTFANACGQVMPPLIIHKGKKVNETWTYGTSPDVMVHTSVKGYINKAIFYEYAIKWVAYLSRHKRLERKNLLLLDAHKSHIYNLRFIRLMIKNGIEVLAIPAHTSHILQPLDSTSFANFKTAWNNSLIESLFKNVGCKMSKQDFWVVLWPAWCKSMTTAVIVRFQENRNFSIQPWHD